MKVTIEKLKNCRHIIEIKLTSEKVKDEFDKVYQDIGKVSNIPGFRVGKAPRELLEQYYSKTAKEEVIKNLIPESYGKVLEQHKIDCIGYPDISDVKLDLKEGFSYKASIETIPEIPLKNYKGLKLKKKNILISEEDIQKNLEYLREANAQVIPKKDSEEKEKKIPDLDDEFAKDLGFEDLEKLKDALRNNLEIKRENEVASDLEMQIVNQLVDSVHFEIPESLVNAEKERILKDANVRFERINSLIKKEKPDKSITLTDKDKDELNQNTQQQAVRQVKVFFILDKIANAEKIYLKQEDIDKYIEEMAGQYKKTKEEMKDTFEKNNMMDTIALNIRNKRVMEFLLQEARVS